MIPPLHHKLNLLAADNRREFFRPTIISHTIGLTVTTIGNWGLPEINLVEVIETVGLAAFGAQQVT